MASACLRVIHRSLREQYKIELRIRNHSTLTRQNLIEAVADSVPKHLKVDLEAPEVFVLVEVFKVKHQLIWAVTADLTIPTGCLSFYFPSKNTEDRVPAG